MPTLREVQAAFARSVLDPSPASVVVGRIVAAGIEPGRRLGVYRNNVLLSLQRVLEGAFPASRRLLGPERFAEIARAFIRAAPPERPLLMTYGAGFPAFIGRSADGESDSYVADVARLDWAREEAYYAADAPPLSATALAAVPAERYPELRFELHPSLRLIRSGGPVYALWCAATTASADERVEATPGGGPQQVLVVRPEMTVTTRPIALADLVLMEGLGGPQQVLVVRPEMTVTTRPIALADLVLMEGLGEGLPLAEAAVRAQAADTDFDLQAALALHLVGGSFAGCG